MEQERHVVAGDVHIALVDLGSPWHGVQVFDLRTVGIVHDLTVRLVADTEDLAERFALGEFDDRVVELAAADEVEGAALVQGLVRGGGHRRPDEGDLDGRIGSLDGLGETLIAFPANGRGEEYEEFVAFADLDGLGGADVVRRSVEQVRAFEQTGGIGEPDGIPVRLDFAGSGPTGTGATIEVLEGGRIEEEGLEWH